MRLTEQDASTLWRAHELLVRFEAGIFNSDGGHLRHLNKLERYGYLAYSGMGRDIDGIVERDVHVFMITPAGLDALDEHELERRREWESRAP